MPVLVDLLLDRSVAVGAKTHRIRSIASTASAVEYLAYRICLAYGHNVLDRATYTEWLEQLEPMVRAGVRRPSQRRATSHRHVPNVGPGWS